MNKKLLYVLIGLFLAAVIVFNIFLKKQPASFTTGMSPVEKTQVPA